MRTQYINIKKCGTINELGLEYGLPLSGNLWGAGTSNGTLSVASNSITSEIYVLSNGGSVQIYNSNRTLNRTITGFGTNQAYIRFNTSQSLYGTLRNVSGAGASVNALRVMNTSNDTQAYLVAFQNGFGFDFNPNNTNVFLVDGGGVVSEFTNAGVLVGSTFTITNVVRSRTMKRQPNTNRIWIGGDSGNEVFNRLSYFDATTRSITDIIVNTSGLVAGRQIGLITGMSFYGSRIFIHHSSSQSSAVAVASKMISEITDTGTIIAQWPIYGNQTNYSDGCVYEAYTEPVIFYARTDNRIIDVVGTLIIPN